MYRLTQFLNKRRVHWGFLLTQEGAQNQYWGEGGGGGMGQGPSQDSQQIKREGEWSPSFSPNKRRSREC